ARTTPPLTVLLAEDEPAVRRLVAGYLADAGHAVLVSASGEEALERADAHAGPIDLLVTDVVMPGMNGRQLQEGLLARRPGVRVVFMSGYPALPGTQEEIVAGGPGAVLAKPFPREELLARGAAVMAAAPATACPV
ncbi:MAG: response regulator, partial [Anaeromyxobacteraceae bacterium]|nr:response regulator [Anaeromyxobacteraceae bacterium]